MNSEISVVVCTRNRGKGLLPTLDSILANSYENFELIVIDQSLNTETESSIATYLHDPRVRYIKSSSQGAGLSRNIGLNEARGSIVAYTDDDCTVPLNWLDEIENIFKTYPEVAVVFFNVEPGPHDAQAGFIPNRIYKEEKVIRSISESTDSLGMAAGMALKKRIILDMGGFDANMGPGSKFMSGEDLDIGLRVLLKGLPICITPSIKVVHYGYRSFGDEFRQLVKRDWFAMGGAYAKLVKCGQKGSTRLILYDSFVKGLWHPMSHIFRLKRPSGFKGFFYFYQGFISGLLTQVEYTNLVYKSH